MSNIKNQLIVFDFIPNATLDEAKKGGFGEKYGTDLQCGIMDFFNHTRANITQLNTQLKAENNAKNSTIEKLTREIETLKSQTPPATPSDTRPQQTEKVS